MKGSVGAQKPYVHTVSTLVASAVLMRHRSWVSHRKQWLFLATWAVWRRAPAGAPPCPAETKPGGLLGSYLWPGEQGYILGLCPWLFCMEHSSSDWGEGEATDSDVGKSLPPPFQCAQPLFRLGGFLL